MSLLDEAMDTCLMLNKVTREDGYGGYETTWTSGAKFDAAIVFDTSMQARTAEKSGVTSLYTVTTRRLCNLNTMMFSSVSVTAKYSV